MKTHWKKMKNPNYLGSWDLLDEEGNPTQKAVTITKVVEEEVMGADGRKDKVMTVHLKDLKPFICNTTNAKMISKVLKSDFIEDWTGKKILLGTERVRAFGAVHDAIRVQDKEVKAAKLPDLTPEHSKWEAAKKALQSGTVTIETLQKKYTITDTNLEKLQS